MARQRSGRETLRDSSMAATDTLKKCQRSKLEGSEHGAKFQRDTAHRVRGGIEGKRRILSKVPNLSN